MAVGYKTEELVRNGGSGWPFGAGQKYSGYTCLSSYMCVRVFSSNSRVPDACSPECVQDRAIGEEADEPVSYRDFMEEGLLRLHNVSVWYPKELHETGV